LEWVHCSPFKQKRPGSESSLLVFFTNLIFFKNKNFEVREEDQIFFFFFWFQFSFSRLRGVHCQLPSESEGINDGNELKTKFVKKKLIQLYKKTTLMLLLFAGSQRPVLK
jgi:hypothetical protein